MDGPSLKVEIDWLCLAIITFSFPLKALVIHFGRMLDPTLKTWPYQPTTYLSTSLGRKLLRSNPRYLCPWLKWRPTFIPSYLNGFLRCFMSYRYRAKCIPDSGFVFKHHQQYVCTVQRAATKKVVWGLGLKRKSEAHVVDCPTRWSLWYWYWDVDHLYFNTQWPRNIAQQCAKAHVSWIGNINIGN